MKLLPEPRIKYVKIDERRMVRADYLSRIDAYIDHHLHLTAPQVFDALIDSKTISGEFDDWLIVLRIRLRLKREKRLRERLRQNVDSLRIETKRALSARDLRRFFTRKLNGARKVAMQ